MANDAQKVLGTSLTKTSGELVVANLNSIGEIGIESDEIEVTDFDSANGFREFIAGLKDGGEVSIAGWVKDESKYESLISLSDTQTVESWEVEFPSGAKWFLRAFVKMMKEAESAVDGARGFTGSLRITGKPVYSSTGISA